MLEKFERKTGRQLLTYPSLDRPFGYCVMDMVRETGNHFVCDGYKGFLPSNPDNDQGCFEAMLAAWDGLDRKAAR